MQNWDTVGGKLSHCRWFGQMTLPRELSIEDGRLYQRPVRELEAYRRDPVVHRQILVSGEANLPGVQGLPRDIVHTRSFLVKPRDGEIRLRVILDRFSVEVFVNDGEAAASAVIYTRQEADAITFEADGQVLIDVEKYDLNFDSGREG